MRCSQRQHPCEGGKTEMKQAMPRLLLLLSGSVAGSVSGVAFAVLVHFILRMPNRYRSGEEVGEFLGLLGTLVVLVIVETYKQCYKWWIAPQPLRIGLIGSATIGFVVSSVTVAAMGATDLLLRHARLPSLSVLPLYGLAAYPLVWLVTVISTVLSLWTTKPRWLRDLVDILVMLEIVEDISDKEPDTEKAKHLGGKQK